MKKKKKKRKVKKERKGKKCKEGVEKQVGCPMNLRSIYSRINEWGDGWKEFKLKLGSKVAEFMTTEQCSSACWLSPRWCYRDE